MPQDQKFFDIAPPSATPATRPIIVTGPPVADPMVKPTVAGAPRAVVPPAVPTPPPAATPDPVLTEEPKPQITQIPVSQAPADPPVQAATPLPEPSGHIQPALPGAAQGASQFGELQAKVEAHPLFSGAKEHHVKIRRIPVFVKPLVFVFVLLTAAYLLIDAGTVRGYSHLPFHIFKAPVANTKAPVITQAPAAAVETGPYAGWGRWTLSAEKLSLRYPNTWTLNPKLSGSYSDSDMLIFTAPGKFDITIATGSKLTSPTKGIIEHLDPVTFAGQSAFLDFWRQKTTKDGYVDGITLSKSMTGYSLDNFFAAKNIQNANAKIEVSVVLHTTSAATKQSLASVMQSSTYKDFKLLIQSFKY